MKELPAEITDLISDLRARKCWFENSGNGKMSSSNVKSWEAAVSLADNDVYVNHGISVLNSFFDESIELFCKKNKAKKNAYLSFVESINLKCIDIVCVQATFIICSETNTKRQRRTASMQLLSAISGSCIELHINNNHTYYRNLLQCYLDGYFPCNFNISNGKHVLY